MGRVTLEKRREKNCGQDVKLMMIIKHRRKHPPKELIKMRKIRGKKGVFSSPEKEWARCKQEEECAGSIKTFVLFPSKINYDFCHIKA